ncbi:MAG: hypothetical protein LBK06_04720 [Planctomycetaceae bacterium]|nr:hypothetical protein [Planctomycetaceae bacterium]
MVIGVKFVLKFVKLNTAAQQREAVVQGKKSRSTFLLQLTKMFLKTGTIPNSFC